MRARVHVLWPLLVVSFVQTRTRQSLRACECTTDTVRADPRGPTASAHVHHSRRKAFRRRQSLHELFEQLISTGVCRSAQMASLSVLLGCRFDARMIR